MINIKNLSVQFGGVKALNGLSVELRAPIIGIIGPNGAGKTTLLNAFSGFVPLSAGSRIEAFGSDLLAMKPHTRARWGLRRSFQTEQIIEDLSVVDNIRVMLDAAPISAALKQDGLLRALRFVGLEAKARWLSSDLNSFERRMLEIGRALAGNPRIVLLDEPGGGFGNIETDALRDVIRRIHVEFGAMTLLIDHDVDLISATCIETMVLDFGCLIAHGPTASVLADPKVKSAYLGDEEIAA